MASRMAICVAPTFSITASKPFVAPEKARICENVTEAAMMNRIMTEIFAVSSRAVRILASENLP